MTARKETPRRKGARRGGTGPCVVAGMPFTTRSGRRPLVQSGENNGQFAWAAATHRGRARIRRTGAAALTVLLLAECSTPVAPPSFPSQAVALQVPAPYTLWWRATEQCSGLNAALSGVKWYVLPSASELVVGGHAYDGYWWPDGNRVVLTKRAALDGQLVRHEMLHVLIGVHGHPRSYFFDRCAGIVACEGTCQAEGGGVPAPDPNGALVDASALDVSVQVTPAVSVFQVDSGWLTVTVSARNPRPQSVWVRLLRQSADAAAGPTFGYTFGNGTEAYLFSTDPRLPFGPGQTTRYMFDAHAAFSPGEYQLRGFFNSDTTSAVVLRVSP